MKKLKFYFKQLVKALELNSMQDDIETAIQQPPMDNALTGVVKGMLSSADFTTKTTVRITPGVAYDALGRRMAITSDLLVDFSTDSNGAALVVPGGVNVNYAYIYLTYTTANSVPLPDGNETVIETVSEDSFETVVVYGTEGENPDGFSPNPPFAIEPTAPANSVLVARVRFGSNVLNFAGAFQLNPAVDQPVKLQTLDLPQILGGGPVAPGPGGFPTTDFYARNLAETTQKLLDLINGVALSSQPIDPPKVYIAEVFTGIAPAGGTVNFEIALSDEDINGGQGPTNDLFTVQAIHVSSNDNVVGGKLELFIGSDRAQSRKVYEVDFKDGAGADADYMFDGTPWAVMAGFPGGLANQVRTPVGDSVQITTGVGPNQVQTDVRGLFGTITNSGNSASEYKIIMFTLPVYDRQYSRFV